MKVLKKIVDILIELCEISLNDNVKMHKTKQVKFKTIINYIEFKLLIIYHIHCLCSILLIKKIKKIAFTWFKILNKFDRN